MAPKVSNRQYKLPDFLLEWEHVSVTWEDAMSINGACNSKTALADFKPCIRHSSGYVILYNDTHLAVASTDDREAGTDADCEDITVIPIAYVRRITGKK